MATNDVLDVTNVLPRAGIDFWLDGGWGIDALMGAQHRRHEDLDIVVPLVVINQVYDAMPNGEDCKYPAHDFTTGRVGETTVGCVSAALQLAHHLGYVPRPHDHDDMARLAERFGLDLPPPYAAQE